MKTRKSSAIVLAVLVVVLGMDGTIAGAQTYLGDFCWSLLITADETGPTTLGPFPTKAGVTYMGGDHYLLQGVTTIPPNPNPRIYLATAVVLGSEVWISGNVSQDNTSITTWRDTGIMQARLSLSTLNGTLWSVNIDFQTSDNSFWPGYVAGTMTSTACP